MKQVRWSASAQDSPRFGALVAGAVVEVDEETAALWMEAGVAEEVESGAKRRRVAAPEPAPEA